MDSMLVPFIMLLIVTIALVLERKYQEEKIFQIYEDKFESWKQHYNKEDDKKTLVKELVGLVYMVDYQVSIEVFNDKVIDPLQRKKYKIAKYQEIKNENDSNIIS